MDARNRYDSLFQFYGEKYGLDWQTLKAQAIGESLLDPNAVSPVGAKGLAQFMDRTWAEWRDGTPGIQDIDLDIAKLSPFDPEDCIRAQAAYMAWILKQVGGELSDALMAYNWGIGNFYKWRKGRRPIIPDETKEYVCRIFGYLNKIPPVIFEKAET